MKMSLINSNIITIDTFTIKQDAQGRYCLNDLHKASGGANKHRPVYYFALASTKELLEEITSQGRDSDFAPVVVSRGGRTPGTYVCPEVVVSYGMWISPAFQDWVIGNLYSLLHK